MFEGVTWRVAFASFTGALVVGTGHAELPQLRVDRDDVKVTQSCQLVFVATPIRDENGNGVVQIEGDDLVIDLGGGTLWGSATDAEPWTRDGTGIVVRGKNITLKNGAVRGFRVGVLAQRSDGFTAADLDLSGNWGARLRSTTTAEDGDDWLWPHHNDQAEWRTRYGAALCIESSKNCTIERVRAVGLGAQNGIMLDRVTDSKVTACDCSFLSGWGLAMWRSSRNEITRNSFDFCVRGYSNGVYNRGQDSAGILMFEQCSDNLIAINSVTHGGDGLFVFAGNEALGADLPEVAAVSKTDAPAEAGVDADDPRVAAARGLGCNRNLIVGNDFSYAVAHGIELTFSFDNVLAFNTMKQCGISGTWGGYSQRTKLLGNVYDGNGSPTNPGEEAGISTEHGADLVITQNTFRNQGVAVKLWWDEDPGLLRKAWVHANGHDCRGNAVVSNSFDACRVGVQLRRCSETRIVGNSFSNVKTEVDAEPAQTNTTHASADAAAAATMAQEAGTLILSLRNRISKIPGSREPIGARAALAGREKIVITERGPYDWSSSLLVFDRHADGVDYWRLLGDAPLRSASIPGPGGAQLGSTAGGKQIAVYTVHDGAVIPYELRVSVGTAQEPVAAHGTLLAALWDARFFAWTVDPRVDLDGWRREAELGDRATLKAMDLRYGAGGPTTAKISDELQHAALPNDAFGMVAQTRVTMPPGRYRFRVRSDDGVRLRADGRTLIERWDWHGPTDDTAEFVVDERREVMLELEHFELDGFAVLSLSVELIAPGASSRATAPPPAIHR